MNSKQQHQPVKQTNRIVILISSNGFYRTIKRNFNNLSYTISHLTFSQFQQSIRGTWSIKTKERSNKSKRPVALMRITKRPKQQI